MKKENKMEEKDLVGVSGGFHEIDLPEKRGGEIRVRWSYDEDPNAIRSDLQGVLSEQGIAAVMNAVNEENNHYHKDPTSPREIRFSSPLFVILNKAKS